jgi:hypothetical protein
MATILDSLHGGSFNDADGADTIAAEIRSALAAVRSEAGITQPMPTGDSAQQMNILFAAIGRGVLNHLSKHPNAIQVNVSDGSLVSIDGYATEIDVQES